MAQLTPDQLKYIAQQSPGADSQYWGALSSEQYNPYAQEYNKLMQDNGPAIEQLRQAAASQGSGGDFLSGGWRDPGSNQSIADVQKKYAAYTADMEQAFKDNPEYKNSPRAQTDLLRNKLYYSKALANAQAKDYRDQIGQINPSALSGYDYNVQDAGGSTWTDFRDGVEGIAANFVIPAVTAGLGTRLGNDLVSEGAKKEIDPGLQFVSGAAGAGAYAGAAAKNSATAAQEASNLGLKAPQGTQLGAGFEPGFGTTGTIGTIGTQAGSGLGLQAGGAGIGLSAANVPNFANGSAALGGANIGGSQAAPAAASAGTATSGAASAGGATELASAAPVVAGGWGDLLAPLATVAGGILGGEATKDAADKASQASADSIAESRRQFDLSRLDLKPWLDTGTKALGELSSIYGLDGTPSANFMDKVSSTPGYQFRFGEGQRALEGSAAARGGLFSGAAGKALTQYGQDYGTNEFTNYTNRLSNLANVGQSTATNLGALGANYAANYGNNVTGAANFGGATDIARGNIYGSTLTGLASLWANRK